MPIVFVLASCSDEVEEKVFDSNLLVGNWCMVDETGEISELTVLSSHTISGCSYYYEDGVKIMSDEFDGVWYYYPQNNVLLMQLSRVKTMQMNTISYQIEKLDKNTMHIRNQEQGNLEAYYHVLGMEKMSIGETLDISLLDVIPNADKFYSSNNEIVNVDAEGNVTAVSAGSAYVMVASGYNAAFLKIEVESRVQVFGNEISMTIDEILEIHGTPDFMGDYMGNQIVAYISTNPDPYLVGSQYYFDADTREIKRILTAYNSSDYYAEDFRFIVSNYYKLGENSYGLWQENLSNDYTIYTVPEQNSINYFNTQYGYRNGHY